MNQTEFIYFISIFHLLILSFFYFRWQPPASGGFSGFKLKVLPLSELTKSIRNIVIREDSSPFPLKDLTPGATYEIQLFTVYENKESAAYISTNFTTKPNTPGRFIVWFRNETTLLVLWQPPYPAGVYTGKYVLYDFLYVSLFYKCLLNESFI